MARDLVDRIGRLVATTSADVDALERTAAQGQGQGQSPAEDGGETSKDIDSRVRSRLADIQSLLDDAQDAVLDVRPSEKELLTHLLSKHRSGFRLLQQRYRSSVLEARAAIEARAQAERAALADAESLVRASNDVTAGLRQAVQMMSAEVERSTETVKLLDESTRTLQKTSHEYSLMGDLLNVSSVIIKDLNGRDWKERAMLAAGLAVFLSTVAYVIGRRVRIPGYRWLTGQCVDDPSWFCF
ncbi:Sec20-domain-containing protein [Entophlyctis helioformis]|nr:Sec20-domain-containing protein [Entophlyctis helioformis]